MHFAKSGAPRFSRAWHGVEGLLVGSLGCIRYTGMIFVISERFSLDGHGLCHLAVVVATRPPLRLVDTSDDRIAVD
jgi:hypothetical protein